MKIELIKFLAKILIMKQFFSVFFILAIQLTIFGQGKPASKYANIVNISGLKKDLSIIASDAMEGRETGTEGQRKAANYIENRFIEIGLSHPKNMIGYQQFFPINQDSIIETSLIFNNEKQIFGSDFISPVSMNENDSFVSDKIIFVGYGIDDLAYSDYGKKDVKGKVVIFFNGEPKKDKNYLISGSEKASNWTRYGLIKKIETAYSKGAIGALYINTNQPTFSSKAIINSNKVYSFNKNNSEETKKVNIASVSHSLAKRIIGVDFDNLLVLSKEGYLLNDISIEKQINAQFSVKKITTSNNAANVIGIIEGSDKKDEFVFLTAHYDHLGNQNGLIYNGADDDGSGTVTVIQMAEAFAKAKKEGFAPRRTIVFMTVSGEEKGLWGSEYYSDHPVFPLDKTTVDLNTDMIGRIDTERKKPDTSNYLYVIGHNKISSDLSTIIETTNKNYSNLVLDYKFDDPADPNRIFYRSDHYNFARKGVPILFFYDGMLKADYHQPTDDIDKINWPLFEKRAQYIFHMAWELANRNSQLVRDIPLSDAE